MSVQTKHSEFGGSVACRVMNCPGSVALLRSVPKRTSQVADKGTWAHALLAYCLEQGYRTADAFTHSSLPLGVEVPEQYSGAICGEIVPPVNVALAEVFAELALSPDAELYVEDDFDLPIGDPGEVFGRGDAVVWHPSLLRLRVIDYKNGAGSIVDVDDNDQLQFYTAGVLHKHPDWKPDQVIITVIQPNPWQVAAGEMEAVKDWETDTLDTTLWTHRYRLAVTAAKVEGQSCKVGPWCDKSFCDARPICPARQAGLSETTGVDVTSATPEQLPAPSEMDLTHLSAVAASAKAVAAWAEQCLEYLEYLMVVQGQVEVPGWKIVAKIGRAKWVEEQDKVVGYAGLMFDLDEDQVAPRKLATITDMTARLKAAGATKEQLEDFKLRFTVKESSGVTIAPSTDRRPAINPATERFGAVSI